MKKRSTTILVAGIVLAILLVVYMAKRSDYDNIFCKNTIINGQDCSLLTVEDAEDLIQDHMDEYILEIRFKDEQSEYISATDVEFTVENLNQELSSIKERQRKDLFFRGGEYELEKLSYNEEKLKEILSGKNQLQLSYMEEMTEIKYEFDFVDNQFYITEQNNYYLDFDTVLKVVSLAIQSGTDSVDIANLYGFSEDNPVILLIEELNYLMNKKVIYQLPSLNEYTLGATTMYTWLAIDEDGNCFKDEELWNKGIENFVTNELSEIVNTVGIPREFKPTGKDETVVVTGGNYGYLVDTDAEIKRLKNDLSDQVITERTPCYAKTEVTTENNGLGNSYVEIDISRQKVWVYVDGNLEVETNCVTGCVKKGHDTPTGICTLTYKTTDKVLRGPILENGKREYESHVDYWMPFNGGVGLHDASWRSSFGGSIYVNNGSHGCINLPFKAAKQIYEIINYEMPIIVYKSEEVSK